MSFGFDPSIILSGQKPDLDGMQRTFADMARLGIQQREADMQQRTSDVQLADMVRKQQQEKTLSDIMAQNSGTFSDPVAKTLAAKGFGKQALDWTGQQAEISEKRAKAQGEQQEWLRKRGELMARPLRDGIPQNQQQMDQLRATWKSMGFSDFDMGGTEIFDPNSTPQLLQQIRALGVSEGDAQKGAHDAAQLSETKRHNLATEDQGQYSLTPNPVTGSMVRLNRKTGGASTVEAGGAPQLGTGPLKPNEVEGQFKDLTEEVSTGKGRARLAPQLQTRLFASERVKNAMLDENGNIKNLSPEMLSEVATATASLLANGGAPTEHAIQQLLPKGRGMKQAELLEWLTNDPQGANQQGFLKQMLNLSEREEGLIGRQIRQLQGQSLPNYIHLRKSNPTRFNSILQAAGVDPSSVDEAGLSVRTLSTEDQAAKKWAESNPNDPRAKAILQRLGGQ
jgi:hypothetical protein